MATKKGEANAKPYRKVTKRRWKPLHVRYRKKLGPKDST